MKQTVPDAGAYRYSPVQRTFHWLMAAIILTAICLGVWAGQQQPGTHPRVEVLEIHKSLGMTALVLLPFRFVMRLIAGEPAWRVPLTPMVRLASHAAHGLLYLAMAVVPLAGYVASGAGGRSLPFFGLFFWPKLAPQDKALAHAAAGVHYYAAWTIIALLVIHIGAAIWHRTKGDEVFARMAPGRLPQG